MQGEEKKGKTILQLYSNKSDNLEEMDNFVETYRQPKVNQEEINNLKRLITKSKIQPVFKKRTNKSSVQDQVVSDKFYKHTYKNVYWFLSNSSKRLKRREHSQRHSMKPHHPDTKIRLRHYQKRKWHVSIFDECRCKNSQRNTNKPNLVTHKKDKIPWLCEIISQIYKDSSKYANKWM